MKGSIVAVVAHPDDESLIAGGTLALAAEAGAAAGVVSLTRGEAGPGAEELEVGNLGGVRELELRRAARELGVTWSACLRHPDGELPWIDQQAAADELVALLAPHAPSVMLTFGPDGLYWHHDHIATREIALLAAGQFDEEVHVYEAAWPSGLMASLVAAAAERGLPVGLWGLEPEVFGSERAPTVVVDVRATLARKLAALRAHRSQIGHGHLFAALPADVAERFLAFEPWAGPGAGALEELIRSV
ncbi:MAG TPA: PIG-L deacetylase family protein [Solirubrobacteraceae bacterium]|jgi:LmbE family N-acetylglucosaminyl deacetylase|nr:PIG-L deacetylase family protein [Solirubrobacteraceae bacterium]